jgi:hypothetical protein
MTHQLQVKRQLLETELLENGEYEFSCFGAEEKIAVFNAG